MDHIKFHIYLTESITAMGRRDGHHKGKGVSVYLLLIESFSIGYFPAEYMLKIPTRSAIMRMAFLVPGVWRHLEKTQLPLRLLSLPTRERDS